MRTLKNREGRRKKRFKEKITSVWPCKVTLGITDNCLYLKTEDVKKKKNMTVKGCNWRNVTRVTFEPFDCDPV